MPHQFVPVAGAGRLALLATALLVAAPGLAAADLPPAAGSATFGVVQGEHGPVLAGLVTRADIVALLPAWNDSAAAYTPDPAAIARLAAVSVPVEITCVLGTWCGDSRREVPRLWRVLDAAANPNLSLKLLAVGRRDDAAAAAQLEAVGLPRDLRAAYALTAVPTIIFTVAGRETGRIVETPTATLEGDAAGFIAPVAEAPAGGAWH